MGSAEMTRKYPIEKWIEVIRGLSDRAVFFISGGPIEEEDGAAIERSVPKDAVCNLTGKLSVEESLAVIAAAELYLGNDTGMMHAAAASGRPIVAVFREAVDREEILTGVLSEYRRFEPWQIPYIALRPEHPLDDCGKSMIYGWCTVHDRPHCITQVKSEEVIEAVNTAFKDFLKK
ncbi:MAG: glycosyltransferase family 9 protein [Schwartzia sp.]|nr:glycosyltransferase family 9 protein [Schwartzia sp. (in: firmicutes)]